MPFRFLYVEAGPKLGHDAGNCRRRVCTNHGFCGTVLRNVQYVPDLPAFLKGQASTKDLKLEIESLSEKDARVHA
jgi:hypothetical protein